VRRNISKADNNRVHDRQTQLGKFIICRRNRLQYLAAGIGQSKLRLPLQLIDPIIQQVHIRIRE
jgi:hypothetical protein